jgi:hypothetical protein
MATVRSRRVSRAKDLERLADTLEDLVVRDAVNR